MLDQMDCGKGGWDSGEIETSNYPSGATLPAGVERVDGTQARLKQPLTPRSSHLRRVERVDGTQARLKRWIYLLEEACSSRGKGGWDSGEIET